MIKTILFNGILRYVCPISILPKSLNILAIKGASGFCGDTESGYAKSNYIS